MRKRADCVTSAVLSSKVHDKDGRQTRNTSNDHASVVPDPGLHDQRRGCRYERIFRAEHQILQCGRWYFLTEKQSRCAEQQEIYAWKMVHLT